LAEALARCNSALTGTCEVSESNSELLDQAGKLPQELTRLTEQVTQAPGVQALEQQGFAAQKQAELARARAIPDPTVSVGYTRDWFLAAGNQAHTLSVGVSLPLAVFDTGYHAMRAASAEALAAREMARALVLVDQGEIRGLLGRKVALETKLQLIVNELLPRGQSLEASSQIAYQQGQLSLTDLVLVRRDLLSLRLDASDTRYQMFAVRNELRRILALDSASGAAR
jgi:cobalt-zinc-cadmium efflux system outer membrane protein